MSQEVTVVFTAKSVETILNEGGSSAWRLDRNHARQCAYAVCTRNAYAKWVEGSEPHHSAFLIGKISDVVPAPGREGRYLLLFSEYALVDIPDTWKGDRNPVRYATLDDLEINPAKLRWQPMPDGAEGIRTEAEPVPTTKRPGEVRALTMLEAKKGLAMTFGVAPEAIEITIRG
jgi:hypothetical protein